MDSNLNKTAGRDSPGPPARDPEGKPRPPRSRSNGEFATQPPYQLDHEPVQATRRMNTQANRSSQLRTQQAGRGRLGD